MILTGDLGGTKTNLAIFADEKELNSPVAEQSFESKTYNQLEDIIKEFLSTHPSKISKACFGVAGPVINGTSKISNLIWTVSEERIRESLGIGQVKLLNDLESMAYGTMLLRDDDVVVLNPGNPEKMGNIAIIAAGTGLGEAYLVQNEHCVHVIPSEGGHADLAPRNEIEIEFLKFMLKEFEHVSYERALSGMGITNIYCFLRSYRGFREPEWLVQRFEREDRNAVISELAQKGNVPICEEAMRLFVGLYGAEAGNWALKTMSTGGVFIGGGIAPKILPLLRDGHFMETFLAKGRLSRVVAQFPVKVILNQKTPILGALFYAQNYMR